MGVGERCGRSASGDRPPGADGHEYRRRGCVATQTREELLLALRVGIARRRSGAVAVGEAAPRQRVRRVARARQVRHVDAEILDLVEPANVHLVQMPARLEPRDCLVVRPQVEIGPAARRPRSPAARSHVLNAGMSVSVAKRAWKAAAKSSMDS